MFQTLLWLSLLSPATDDPIEVNAVLGPLSEAGRCELHVDLQLAEGWSTPRNALLPATRPAAMLQLDVPAGLRPVGKPATDLDEHLRAFFLDVPYEHLLETGRNSISLELTGEIERDAVLGFNVLLYVLPPGSEGERAARLVRHRYVLSLEDGDLSRASAEDSNWGSAGFLQLGALATPFELPTPQGDFQLADALGDGYVVVTTQRSCL